jgi:SAM-dependent methyltransferase
MTQVNSEADAIADRYKRRKVGDLYSMTRPEVLLSFQERQRHIISILRRYAPRSFDELRVLEVGCGMGSNLLELLHMGFDPAHLVGVELLPQRAAKARRRLPEETKVIEGDATLLNFAAESFDVVYVSVVFSSLLDAEFQQQLANKMWSWVRPGGGVLWYDFLYDNPRNKDVKGVPMRRVRELFPSGDMVIRKVTLAPPIGRVVCKLHPRAYHVLNALPLLRTHVLCWIGKR